MATLAKSLEDAAKDIMKDYNKAAKNAAEYATKKVAEDFEKRAYDGLKKYYDFLTAKGRPKSYKRSYRLHKSIKSIQGISQNKNKMICTMGVVFDSDLLKGFYDDEPSRKYRGYAMPGYNIPAEVIPINVWIMNNFLDGIHTETNGATRVGEVKYKETIDFSVNNNLDGFVETADYFFTRYFSESLFAQIIQKM